MNVYVLMVDGGPVLIDSGWYTDEARLLLEQGLAALGFELGDISMFLMTHVHRDHYELGMRLRRLLGARVLLSIDEHPSLKVLMNPPAPEESPLHDRMIRAGAPSLIPDMWRSRRRAAIPWDLPDAWLRAPEVLDVGGKRVEVVPTPGHTQGHVVFVDRSDNVMFAGDHILPRITPSIGFEQAPVESCLADYLASLALVRAAPDMRLLPAHGEPGPSTHVRIDELLAHHDERLGRSWAAIARGAETAFEVAHELPWSRGVDFVDLDPFHRVLAVNETAAHLDVLVRRDRLAAEQDAEGVLRYRAS